MQEIYNLHIFSPSEPSLYNNYGGASNLKMDG